MTKASRAAAAWGDYDNDGFLDLFVVREAGVAVRILLYRNNGNINAWIKMKLVGTGVNRLSHWREGARASDHPWQSYMADA